VRLSGSPLGIHATGKGDSVSLCGLGPTPNGKIKVETAATGTAVKLAATRLQTS
jgi:hypothetical protein